MFLPRLEVQCEGVEAEINHIFPAFSVESSECGLQKDRLLFSCAGANTKYHRLCPCRDYRKGQVALCRDCLWLWPAPGGRWPATPPSALAIPGALSIGGRDTEEDGLAGGHCGWHRGTGRVGHHGVEEQLYKDHCWYHYSTGGNASRNWTAG